MFLVNYSWGAFRKLRHPSTADGYRSLKIAELGVAIADFGPLIADFLSSKVDVTKNATRVSERLWLIRAKWQLATENWE
jgi:hypothetical protein